MRASILAVVGGSTPNHLVRSACDCARPVEEAHDQQLLAGAESRCR